jgi:hypothetical protein
MKRLLLALLFPLLVVGLSGCLTSPVERSGGPGSITVPNSNPEAIRRAAIAIFPRYGYSPGPGSFPSSMSFQRPSGRTGEVMFGGFNQTTFFRVRIQIIPIAGTSDIRLTTQVYRVTNADQPGFARETAMFRSWSSQFQSILRKIRSQAEDAGPLPLR